MTPAQFLVCMIAFAAFAAGLYALAWSAGYSAGQDRGFADGRRLAERIMRGEAPEPEEYQP